MVAMYLAAMFSDVRSFTALYNDITPTVSKYWEGPGNISLHHQNLCMARAMMRCMTY